MIFTTTTAALLFLAPGSLALSSSAGPQTSVISSRPQLLANLQQSFAPDQVLERVGQKLSPRLDPKGEVSRLALVRLSKQLIAIDNKSHNQHDLWFPEIWESWAQDNFESLVDVLLESSRQRNIADSTTIENVVEGVKALSIISRLVPDIKVEGKIVESLNEQQETLEELLHDKPHLLSGLDWAFENFRLKDQRFCLSENLSGLVAEAGLSFKIYPGLLGPCTSLSIDKFSRDVDFRVETIRTASEKVVQERRQTAWQGDDGIGPFLYSGKSMPRRDWSSSVREVRDVLKAKTGQYYDCCLLNLYPDGGSGMRYHIDPDQGSLWDYDTVVVSVGATRRFAFRSIEDGNAPPHSFVVMHGDVTWMFSDCQERFQHSVKKAEQKDETSPRISLVYKRTWPGNH
uniref:Fe2OG dioxygenase domain-containing protein n=1 Tax=Amphora coffeiformis TaxID=265554 RepID=A0A7S3L5Z7_9STRA